MAEITSNTVQAMNDSSGDGSKVTKNGTFNDGMKRFEGLMGGKNSSF